MSRIHRRLAPSYRTILAAACLTAVSAPAFAADTVLNIPAGTTSFSVIASPAAGDTYTVNNLGAIGFDFLGFGAVNVQGSGAGTVVINNDGRLLGPLNFTAATGSVTLHNNAGAAVSSQGWINQGVTNFGSGADLLDNAADGVITANAAATFAFGGGIDRFVNAGQLSVTTLTLTGLETLENSGTIVLGASPSGGLASLIDDRLNAQGVAFTGAGGRILMDVNLAGVTQATCAGVAAADCVDFTGGSTAGSTLLLVNDTDIYNAPALNSGITLIVGSSAAEHFSLDPASEGYVAQTSSGGALQKGLVAYRLDYDDAGDRHMLVGVLADEAVQAATFAASAQETWRATTGSWLTRQADLRATPGGLESSNGLWGRAGFAAGERELAISSTQGASTYSYDAGHKQRIAHLMFGADILAGGTADTAWVVGGMLGMTRSDVEYDASPTEVIYKGVVGGLYASYLAGPLFVDAVVNANLLNMDAEVTNMGLGNGVNLTQDFKSVGGQIEAGWRVDIDGGVFIEPLVGASYIKTEFEDIEAPGGTGSLDFDDSYTSTRFGAGLRGGLDTQLMGHAASISLTGRYWSETDGENAILVLVTNGASSTPVMDDFGGGFAEVGASLNLYSTDGGVSGFANLGGKFADDYRSVDASVGVRMRW